MTNEAPTLQPLVHRIKDAASRIGVSRSYFYELVGAGKIRTIKIGSRVVVTETELQRVVAEAMQEAA